MTHDEPLLDSAQEVLRFLDGYFPTYLAQASMRLDKARPVVIAGGGLGLLALLLAREGGFTVYVWEQRAEWRVLAEAWAAENGVERLLRFVPVDALEEVPRDPAVQGVILEPPLVSLFDTPQWWRETRAVLDWAGCAPLLPSALEVRVAMGSLHPQRDFLDVSRMQALAAHYRSVLDADLTPLLETAYTQLHPRLLYQAPAEQHLATPWVSQVMDLSALRATLEVPLATERERAVDRVYVTLALRDPDGATIGSSLFESHQRLELTLPQALRWPVGGQATLRIAVGPHGFEQFILQFAGEVASLRGRGPFPHPQGGAWSTAAPPRDLASWPASAPRFHVADHLAMLEDRPRVDAYLAALRARLGGGERVLDLGTGSGVLTLAALRAGASSVRSVERDDAILEVARRVFAASGVADRVDPVHGLSSGVAASERADLLVSEILGDKALNEGVLEYMADARTRLCRDGAGVVPGRLEVRMVGAQSGQYVGHVMQGIRQHLEGDMQVRAATYADVAPRLLTGSVARFDAARDRVLTEPVLVGDFDLETLAPDAIAFSREATLEVVEGGVLNGFFVWFTAQLAEGVTLTNSPFEERTHWRQMRLHDFPPRTVQRGDRVRVAINYRGELRIRLL